MIDRRERLIEASLDIHRSVKTACERNLMHDPPSSGFSDVHAFWFETVALPSASVVLTWQARNVTSNEIVSRYWAASNSRRGLP